MKNNKNRILGIWKQVLPKQEFKESYAIFQPDGLLIFEDHLNDTIGRIQMTYVINGNKIITDQPSSPSREVTRFKFVKRGLLELNSEGQKYLYGKLSSTKK